MFQPPPVRDRRRPRTRTRSQSTDSEDEPFPGGEVNHSQSPQSIAQSPRSDTPPAPSNWTASQEQAAQEAYEVELADQYIYDPCDCLPAPRGTGNVQHDALYGGIGQTTACPSKILVRMAMVGKAHHERTDYTSVRTRPLCCPSV
jgi:anaphase-promoting complex subunit 3